uniref:Uncharacterized protein AlNc14C77G5138 n=1 Tax=Albugo laibachii Nc14 TaxID=890382 RepID=F0WET8_9STRA|nr:conserved hypothetical protein [Albugo laibachii Nc14]|eukprot:CCA19720.1 conserved hypothetical protein [Albugo laibachii Nc14]
MRHRPPEAKRNTNGNDSAQSPKRFHSLPIKKDNSVLPHPKLSTSPKNCHLPVLSPRLLGKEYNAIKSRNIGVIKNHPKLRCIVLPLGEDEQVPISHVLTVESPNYSVIRSSQMGQLTLHKIAHSDALAIQLEQCCRYPDAVDTMEQSCKMLFCCIEKYRDTVMLSADDLKSVLIDYNVRCEKLVTLCISSAQKYDAAVESSAFLLLKKAEEFTSVNGFRYEKRLRQRVCIYLSFAIYYKKRSKLQAALQASMKAARINGKLKLQDQNVMAPFTVALIQGYLNESADALKSYDQCLCSLGSLETTLVDTKEERKNVIFKAATLHNMAIEASRLRLAPQTQEYLTLANETMNVSFISSDHTIFMRILETQETLCREFRSSITLDPENEGTPRSQPQQMEAQLPRPSRPRTPSRQIGAVVPSPRATRRLVGSSSNEEQGRNVPDSTSLESNDFREDNCIKSEKLADESADYKRKEIRSMIRAEALRYKECKKAIMELQTFGRRILARKKRSWKKNIGAFSSENVALSPSKSKSRKSRKSRSRFMRSILGLSCRKKAKRRRSQTRFRKSYNDLSIIIPIACALLMKVRTPKPEKYRLSINQMHHTLPKSAGKSLRLSLRRHSRSRIVNNFKQSFDTLDVVEDDRTEVIAQALEQEDETTNGHEDFICWNLSTGHLDVVDQSSPLPDEIHTNTIESDGHLILSSAPATPEIMNNEKVEPASLKTKEIIQKNEFDEEMGFIMNFKDEMIKRVVILNQLSDLLDEVVKRIIEEISEPIVSRESIVEIVENSVCTNASQYTKSAVEDAFGISVAKGNCNSSDDFSMLLAVEPNSNTIRDSGIFQSDTEHTNLDITSDADATEDKMEVSVRTELVEASPDKRERIDSLVRDNALITEQVSNIVIQLVQYACFIAPLLMDMIDYICDNFLSEKRAFCPSLRDQQRPDSFREEKFVYECDPELVPCIMDEMLYTISYPLSCQHSTWPAGPNVATTEDSDVRMKEINLIDAVVSLLLLEMVKNVVIIRWDPECCGSVLEDVSSLSTAGKGEAIESIVCETSYGLKSNQMDSITELLDDLLSRTIDDAKTLSIHHEVDNFNANGSLRPSPVVSEFSQVEHFSMALLWDEMFTRLHFHTQGSDIIGSLLEKVIEKVSKDATSPHLLLSQVCVTEHIIPPDVTSPTSIQQKCVMRRMNEVDKIELESSMLPHEEIPKQTRIATRGLFGGKVRRISQEIETCRYVLEQTIDRVCRLAGSSTVCVPVILVHSIHSLEAWKDVSDGRSGEIATKIVMEMLEAVCQESTKDGGQNGVSVENSLSLTYKLSQDDSIVAETAQLLFHLLEIICPTHPLKPAAERIKDMMNLLCISEAQFIPTRSSLQCNMQVDKIDSSILNSPLRTPELQHVVVLQSGACAAMPVKEMPRDSSRLESFHDIIDMLDSKGDGLELEGAENHDNESISCHDPIILIVLMETVSMAETFCFVSEALGIYLEDLCRKEELNRKGPQYHKKSSMNTIAIQHPTAQREGILVQLMNDILKQVSQANLDFIHSKIFPSSNSEDLYLEHDANMNFDMENDILCHKQHQTEQEIHQLRNTASTQTGGMTDALNDQVGEIVNDLINELSNGYFRSPDMFHKSLDGGLLLAAQGCGVVCTNEACMSENSNDADMKSLERFLQDMLETVEGIWKETETRKDMNDRAAATVARISIAQILLDGENQEETQIKGVMENVLRELLMERTIAIQESISIGVSSEEDSELKASSLFTEVSGVVFHLVDILCSSDLLIHVPESSERLSFARDPSLLSDICMKVVESLIETLVHKGDQERPENGDEEVMKDIDAAYHDDGCIVAHLEPLTSKKNEASGSVINVNISVMETSILELIHNLLAKVESKMEPSQATQQAVGTIESVYFRGAPPDFSKLAILVNQNVYFEQQQVRNVMENIVSTVQIGILNESEYLLVEREVSWNTTTSKSFQSDADIALLMSDVVEGLESKAVTHNLTKKPEKYFVFPEPIQCAKKRPARIGSERDTPNIHHHTKINEISDVLSYLVQKTCDTAALASVTETIQDILRLVALDGSAKVTSGASVEIKNLISQASIISISEFQTNENLKEEPIDVSVSNFTIPPPTMDISVTVNIQSEVVRILDLLLDVACTPPLFDGTRQKYLLIMSNEESIMIPFQPGCIMSLLNGVMEDVVHASIIAERKYRLSIDRNSSNKVSSTVPEGDDTTPSRDNFPSDSTVDSDTDGKESYAVQLVVENLCESVQFDFQAETPSDSAYAPPRANLEKLASYSTIQQLIEWRSTTQYEQMDVYASILHMLVIACENDAGLAIKKAFLDEEMIPFRSLDQQNDTFSSSSSSSSCTEVVPMKDDVPSYMKVTSGVNIDVFTVVGIHSSNHSETGIRECKTLVVIKNVMKNLVETVGLCDRSDFIPISVSKTTVFEKIKSHESYPDYLIESLEDVPPLDPEIEELMIDILRSAAVHYFVEEYLTSLLDEVISIRQSHTINPCITQNNTKLDEIRKPDGASFDMDSEQNSDQREISSFESTTKHIATTYNPEVCMGDMVYSWPSKELIKAKRELTVSSSSDIMALDQDGNWHNMPSHIVHSCILILDELLQRVSSRKYSVDPSDEQLLLDETMTHIEKTMKCMIECVASIFETPPSRVECREESLLECTCSSKELLEAPGPIFDLTLTLKSVLDDIISQVIASRIVNGNSDSPNKQPILKKHNMSDSLTPYKHPSPKSTGRIISRCRKIPVECKNHSNSPIPFPISYITPDPTTIGQKVLHSLVMAVSSVDIVRLKLNLPIVFSEQEDAHVEIIVKSIMEEFLGCLSVSNASVSGLKGLLKSHNEDSCNTPQSSIGMASSYNSDDNHTPDGMVENVKSFGMTQRDDTIYFECAGVLSEAIKFVCAYCRVSKDMTVGQINTFGLSGKRLNITEGDRKAKNARNVPMQKMDCTRESMDMFSFHNISGDAASLDFNRSKSSPDLCATQMIALVVSQILEAVSSAPDLAHFQTCLKEGWEVKNPPNSKHLLQSEDDAVRCSARTLKRNESLEGNQRESDEFTCILDGLIERTLLLCKNLHRSSITREKVEANLPVIQPEQIKSIDKTVLQVASDLLHRIETSFTFNATPAKVKYDCNDPSQNTNAQAGRHEDISFLSRKDRIYGNGTFRYKDRRLGGNDSHEEYLLKFMSTCDGSLNDLKDDVAEAFDAI